MSKTKLDSPNVRKWIKAYLDEHRDLTLQDVARGYRLDQEGRRRYLLLTPTWKAVAMTMLCDAVEQGEMVWRCRDYLTPSPDVDVQEGIDYVSITYRIPFTDCENAKRIIYWADRLNENEHITHDMVQAFLRIVGPRIGWDPDAPTDEQNDSGRLESNNE